LGKLAKPTQGPFKTFNIHQLQSMVRFSYSHHRLRLSASTFTDCCQKSYNWGCECHTSVIMTLWPTYTLIHDITTKYLKPAKLTIWLVIQNV
jgi:hypothetical protein